ncbi:hypothetical protein U1P98_23175 [Lysinibacillus irui]|uniref:Phage portal protein n=1 Tax=Lysinibacillus irui TaxID=2998077 RepID=A0ABU5NT17_9BACI|nr:hypothetical protein [Lysinibacillus irui]MEA0556459.1 hypothetical protein [Lysinibacillus irui]MEA0979186.1 hypothetical protein [Lysinibacillus irui]MEA1045340.1 hypothetical protein [Lysinibacillus irui]
MDALHMTDELVAFFTKELSEMQLQTKDETVFKAPTVYDGYLPQKKNGRRGEEDTEQDDYPFVIVRFLYEKDDLKDKNVMKFRLLIGTYSKDDRQGWRDTLHVMNRMKFALKEVGCVGPGELTGEIELALFEEQMKPMWRGVMEVDIATPAVKLDRSEFGDDFNY